VTRPVRNRQPAEPEPRRGRRLRAILVVGVFAVLAIGVSRFQDFRRTQIPPEHWAGVDGTVVRSLRSFRAEYPVQRADAGGRIWEYRRLGAGTETVLFLHGMGGDASIWWQQLKALRDQFKLISVTYPEVSSLEELAEGIWAVMARERVDRVHVVGTSLGGYLAQYLATRRPHVVASVVLGNTFPPNDRIAADTRSQARWGPFLPGWIVLRFFDRAIQEELVPAAGGSELVRAYLQESAAGMTRRDFLGRYACVIERFEPPDLGGLGIPTLIIQSDNDPSVPPPLRAALIERYPTARVVTLSAAGHLPYLNRPWSYSEALTEHLEDAVRRDVELAKVTDPAIPAPEDEGRTPTAGSSR
jgi:maspardin